MECSPRGSKSDRKSQVKGSPTKLRQSPKIQVQSKSNKRWTLFGLLQAGTWTCAHQLPRMRLLSSILACSNSSRVLLESRGRGCPTDLACSHSSTSHCCDSKTEFRKVRSERPLDFIQLCLRFDATDENTQTGTLASPQKGCQSNLQENE